MNRIVVVVMGQDCSKFLKMCLESVNQADHLIYCDGGSSDNSINIAEKYGAEIISNRYDQEDKAMNGRQRNFYLNYIKKTCPNWWCLVCDADEIVEDFSKINEFINKTPEGIYSVKMRHLIGDLAHEDSTVETHWVPNRLFKIKCAEKYPEVEHPVLFAKSDSQVGGTDCTTIWHLAYIPNMWDIKKRYENHLKKSNMHTPQFLKGWYYAHLFGSYPKKEFNPVELPSEILNEFKINKDELYFMNRNIEMKHHLMVKQWWDHFKPTSVLDLGCGRGTFLYYWHWFTRANGIDISQWAAENAFCEGIDVLEHLDNDQLNSTLKNMAKYGKKFIFSIPFVGDPNLLNDKTHKQFKTKEEWIKLIEKCSIKIKETPTNWHYHSQILIGEKEDSFVSAQEVM